MKILPQGFRVYIVLDKVESGKVGGVYLPDKHSEQSRIGTIKAVGKEVEDYKAGDRVLVQYYSGVAIHLIKEGILDDTNRIFNASNILSLVEE